MDVITKRCARVFIVFMLAITMVLGAIPIIPGAYADSTLKSSSVVITKENEENQPAANGAYEWAVINMDYEVMYDDSYESFIDIVSSDDFVLQTKKDDSDSSWTEVTGINLSVKADEAEADVVLVTADIPDNSDAYTKLWKIVYKHSDESMQVEPGDSIFYRQLEGEAASDPVISEVNTNSVELSYTGEAQNATITLKGANLKSLSKSDFTLEVKGQYGWMDDYDITWSYTAATDAIALIKLTFPANTGNADQQYRLTMNKGADSINNVVLFTLKAEEKPLPVISEVNTNSVELSYTGEAQDVTITLKGSNLKSLSKSDFTLEVKGQYGWMDDYDITWSFTAATDAIALIKLTFPANTEKDDQQYRLTMNKGADSINNVVLFTLKANVVAVPVITSMTATKTELEAAGGEVKINLKGENLTALEKKDFTFEKMGQYGWMELYESDLARTYTAFEDGIAQIAFTLPENTSKEDEKYRITANEGADSIDNKVVITVKGVPTATPIITEMTATKTELEAAGGEVKINIKGENLTALEKKDFTFENMGQYGWMELFESDLARTYTAFEDGIAQLAFTLPENASTEDAQYRITANKGADSIDNRIVITVKAPGSTVPEGKPENVYVYIENDQFQPAAGGSYVWTSVNADWSIYEDFSNVVDANDYALQTQDSAGDWTNVEADLSISFEFSDEYYDYIATITTVIPDNEDQTNKLWRLVYKYSDPSIQVESGTNTYTQTGVTDKSALEAAITAAQAAQEGVNVSEDGTDVEPTEKYVTAAEKEALDQAIASAQAVCDDPIASQTNIDNAVTALNAATATFEAAKKDGKKETDPVVEKPVNVVISRGDGITEEDQYQPASGGTYIWTVSDINYGKLDGIIDENDFKLQTKKVADNDWADATEGSLSLVIDVDEEYGMDMATISATIPDNTDNFDKDWRIAYIYTEPDSQYETCGAEFYTQMAAEEPPVEKMALVIMADEESVSADGGSISWGVFSYEGEDLEGAITGADFTVQVDGADAGIDAVFEVGNNDDEGTVTVTVPANEAAAEKSWTLKYDGELYVQSGEGFRPGDCPAITQAAAQAPEPQKPSMLIIDRDGDENQPASAGEYTWTAINGSGIESLDGLVSADDFTIKTKKQADNNWSNATVGTISVEAIAVPGDTADEKTGLKVTARIPENTDSYDKCWAIVYGDPDAEPANPSCNSIQYVQEAGAPATDPEVDAVEERINALPAADAVTVDDKAAIEEARAAYDALTDEQKAKVDADTLKKLTDAEEALQAAEEAAADTAAADAVKEKINALPAADAVTVDDKAAIEAARAAYDALTDEQKANIDADTLKKLTDAEKALSDAQAAAQAAEAQKAAEEKAKSITSVTVSGKTVNADAINAAIAAAGGRPEYVTEIVLDKSVKKISKSAFAGTQVTTLIVKTKKLTKKSVKGSLKGSSVKTVKVQIGKAKVNKKYVKKYKKIFTKKNAGKKVKVKK